MFKPGDRVVYSYHGPTGLFQALITLGTEDLDLSNHWKIDQYKVIEAPTGVDRDLGGELLEDKYMIPEDVFYSPLYKAMQELE